MATFATINGHRIHYRLDGEGPLAVFGHGLMGSMGQIEENLSLLDALLGSVRLLTYDARGHGQSGGPEDVAGYTWEALGRDMSELATHAGEERAFFGGASMGAATALWVGVEQPEKVRGLVLVMPPPLGQRSMRAAHEHQALQALEMLAAGVENFGVEKTVELARMFPGFATSPEEADQRAAAILKQNPLAMLYAIRGLIQAPFHDPEEYRRVTAPTLILAHEGDGLHPARAAHLLHEQIAGSRLRIAPDPLYWRTHQGEFLGEVSEFLAVVGSQ